MKRILCAISIIILLLIFGCAPNNATIRGSYAVLLGVNPEDSSILANYDMVVIDAQYFTKEEIAVVQTGGTAVYTYLNIGSIETFRDGYDSLKQFALSPYENWPDEYWMDVSRSEWQSFIASETQGLIDKGVDGFFLDNADVYYLYPSIETYEGLNKIISALSEYGKPILVNGGDVFITAAVLDATQPLSGITGVNQECVFTNINFTLGTLARQDDETSWYYQDYLTRCKAAGLDVYLTEYAPKGSDAVNEIGSFSASNGFDYYVSSSINLDE